MEYKKSLFPQMVFGLLTLPVGPFVTQHESRGGVETQMEINGLFALVLAPLCGKKQKSLQLIFNWGTIFCILL